MWTGYAGEVCHASRHTGRADTIHIREQTQIERDLAEDGAQDSRPLEDEARGLPGSGQKHLHEAGSIMMWMFLQYIKDMWSDAVPWIYAVIIMAVVLLILSTAIGIEP